MAGTSLAVGLASTMAVARAAARVAEVVEVEEVACPYRGSFD